MKTMLLSVAILLAYGVRSQPKFSRPIEPSIQPALNGVMQDYFRHFEKSKGDSLSASAWATTFESRIKLPGALSCMITEYSLPGTYSWEAIMYEGEDYKAAGKKYNQYFRELNNSKFTPNGFEQFVLKGEYDAPDEDRGFASSVLQLEAPRKSWDHFFINVEMQYQFPNWVIKISMYEKVPDKDMRPGMKTLK